MGMRYRDGRPEALGTSHNPVFRLHLFSLSIAHSRPYGREHGSVKNAPKSFAVSCYGPLNLVRYLRRSSDRIVATRELTGRSKTRNGDVRLSAPVILRSGVTGSAEPSSGDSKITANTAKPGG
jgi:hypothetical protein